MSYPGDTSDVTQEDARHCNIRPYPASAPELERGDTEFYDAPDEVDYDSIFSDDSEGLDDPEGTDDDSARSSVSGKRPREEVIDLTGADREVAPVAPEEGNTSPPQKKKRVTASLRWCFTFFTNEAIQTVMAPLAPWLQGWVVGVEVCPSTGRRHLQGYIKMKSKGRPMEGATGAALPGAHWEKAKGTDAANFTYCTKEGQWEVFGQIDRPRAAVRVVATDDLYVWQRKIWDLIHTQADDRTIHWFWEPTGAVGKSALVKKICVEVPGSLVVAGKAADMKHAIAATMKESESWTPEVIMFDVPRTQMQYVSYTGMEEIKNGTIFSSKYESGQCLFNPPHMLVFSNSPPDLSAMSADRWNVVNLAEDEEYNGYGYESEEV